LRISSDASREEASEREDGFLGGGGGGFDGGEEAGCDAEGLDGLRGGGREEEREVGGELEVGSGCEERPG